MSFIEGGIGPYALAGVPGAGTSAVQTLTIGGTPTGGTFKLKYDGYVTSAIAWTDVDNTLIAAIDAALEALPNVGTGGVTVADGTLTSGIGTVTITFGGNLAKKVVPLITRDENSLTGTDPTVIVEETTAGVDASFRGASKGALVTDVTNGVLYINTGTALAPTWTKVGTQS